jgi:dTDP-4-dehydrorhamnose reductase
MTQKITAITGSSGALGIELKKYFPNALCPTHEKLDICDQDQVQNYFQENKINNVIHTAAMTSVRECEKNKELAWKTNVEGTKNMVKAFKKTNGNYFVYISTACVFSGDEYSYTEESIPYPVNFYGMTKLIAEESVETIKKHLVIRTNFVAKKTWPYPKAFTDRFGTYLFSANVAKGIKELFDEKIDGKIHLAGDKILSMYDLAKITTKKVKPMTLDEYSGPHLTKNMTLDTKRWKKYTIT